MRRVWATADWIGTGTNSDPFRPDVDAIEASGWAGFQLSDSKALVYAVVADAMDNAELRSRGVDVVHGEDEQDSKGRRERIPDAARDAVETTLKDHGHTDVDYTAMNVNPRSAVERG